MKKFKEEYELEWSSVIPHCVSDSILETAKSRSMFRKSLVIKCYLCDSWWNNWFHHIIDKMYLCKDCYKDNKHRINELIVVYMI